MRGMHIEDLDLNLLKVMGTLFEERHISRAAARAHLSQPAMSRALARLRVSFDDELLVRTPNGYQLTPRARALQSELEAIMPRITAMVRGGTFDPATTNEVVRMDATDYALRVFAEGIFHRTLGLAPLLSMQIDPLSASTFEDLDRGRTHVAMTPIQPPPQLRWQTLFREDFVAVMAQDHPLSREGRVRIEDLSSFPTATVRAMASERMIVDSHYGRLGVRPTAHVRVPYFLAAIYAVPGTDIVSILPRRFVTIFTPDPRLTVVEAPEEIGPFDYGMVWHPRLDEDPLHRWFRERLVEATSA